MLILAFRVFGSKLIISGWVLFASVLWAFKTSMLFFYIRLTVSSTQLLHIVRCNDNSSRLAYIGVILNAYELALYL